MAINDLTTGIGTLAHVAWTPLDGTGLSTAQRTSVDNDVKAASAMATALLEATKSAFNRDWARFSLNDLADAAGLGAFAYLSRTDLRVSTLAATDDTAADWAAFIGRALGSAPATSQARSLGEWRRLAADLQQYAALQASKFDAGRDPSLGIAGGVTHAHGQWYANGQALSLLDLFTAARVNQVANHEDALDDYMIQIQANGRRLAAAREWAAAIRKHMPATDAGNGTLPELEKTNFVAKWGFNPVTEFHKPATAPSFGSVVYQNFNLWLNDIKAYVDDKDQDNQALQQKLQQKSNRRDEVLEAMVTFASKQSKTGANMAGNLA
jgi:hypothetical protein